MAFYDFRLFALEAIGGVGYVLRGTAIHETRCDHLAIARDDLNEVIGRVGAFYGFELDSSLPSDCTCRMVHWSWSCSARHADYLPDPGSGTAFLAVTKARSGFAIREMQ